MSLRLTLHLTIVVFLLQALPFSWSLWSHRNLVRVVRNVVVIPGLGATAKPTFLYNITGDWLSGRLGRPMAVAVVGRQIYVTDAKDARVHVFDYEGHSVLNFGKYGTAPGEFRFPYGIAVDSSGRIYVADLYVGAISVFDPGGNFLNYFGEKNPGEGLLSAPAGLTIAGGNLYVTDVNRSQVLVFDLQGRKLREFGKPGKGPDDILSPNAVAVAGDHVYVSDTANNRIQVFDAQGKYLRTLTGSDDPKQTVFVNVRGLGLDGRGVLYAVSNMTNVVEVFDPSGKRLFNVGGPGAGDGQLYLPNGLFVDNQGRLYVTEPGNGRVSVWQG